MARQYVVSGGLFPAFLNDTGIRQEFTPAGFVNETGTSPPLSTNVAAGAITLTGYVPAASSDAASSVSSGAISVTGYAPASSSDAVLAVSSGAIAFIGYAPVSSSNSVLSVSAGSVILTGYAPESTLSTAQTIPSGAIGLTGQVPVSVYDTVVSVPAGAIGLTGGQNLTSSFDIDASIAAGLVHFAGYAPTSPAQDGSVLSGAIAFVGYPPIPDGVTGTASGSEVNYGDLVLWLPFDGNTLDYSRSHHIMNDGIIGSPLVTTPVKFGSGALNSSTGGLRVFDNNTDFDFGVQPFHIDLWAYAKTAPSGNAVLLGNFQFAPVGNDGWDFGFISPFGDTLTFMYSLDGSTRLAVRTSYIAPVNQWVNYTVERDETGLVTIYADGVPLNSAVVPMPFHPSPTQLRVGNDPSGLRAFDGYMDEVRIGRGFNLHTGVAFTPPTTSTAPSTVGATIGVPAEVLPGQIILWGLTPDGPGSIIIGTANDRNTDVGPPSNILFTGKVPSGDIASLIAGPGGIIFTGRKPGAIFVRYRDPRTPSLFAVELDVYSPGGGEETLRVSDIGYRSRASDTIGLQVYPSVLNIAFDIDRHLGLEPGASSSAGFGSVTLHNVGQRFDNYTLSRNSDSRNIKILVGNKSTDSDRGVLVDPPYAELRPFFGGAALPWTLSEGSLEIPLRDATYWADRPLQTKLYDGNGGYGGGPDLKGKPLPVTRGGLLPNNPVENVPLVAVDTVNLIYQWTDGPGHLVNLYEGGALVFSSEGTTTNLYSGAPSPGAYRVDESRGLVQLGSRPIRTLTADVTGAFAVAGHKSTAVDIARLVLTELMGQPESELELASWYNAESRYPYTAGFFVGPEQQQGLDTVRYLLGSIGARLFTFRNGKLGVSILRALAPDVVPSFTINRDTAMAVEPVPLPASLDPPPWRWRVGSYRMHQVQTSDFDEAINPVRKTHIGQEYPFLSLSEAPELKDVWRRPNDPDPVRTALINVYAAQDLSDDMLALWRGRPGLYQVTMPYEQSAEMEIGDVVLLDWPLADLDGGRAGQVVGEQVRSYDGTGKIYVLAG